MAMFTSGPYTSLIAKRNASGITWNELSEKKKHGTVVGGSR
jgi:hypothetical protein